MPIDRLASAVDSFLVSHPSFIAVDVGPGELPLPPATRSRVFTGLELPLVEAMATVASADLFLGIDSCMLHVADLARVPGSACSVRQAPPSSAFASLVTVTFTRVMQWQDIAVSDVVSALDALTGPG